MAITSINTGYVVQDANDAFYKPLTAKISLLQQRG